MNKEVVTFLRTQRVGVLAVLMPNGKPHAASLHFAHCEGPFVFFFETQKSYQKAEPLLAQEKTNASFVVGVDDSNMKTVQLDGTISIITDEEKELFESTYYTKFPEKMQSKGDAGALFFKFVPDFWKFTDWTRPEGKFVLKSEKTDIYDESKNKTGEARTLDDVHWYGLRHRTIRLWFVNSKNQVLIQHRNHTSINFPDLWDSSAGGHIPAGEESLNAALREAKEELGVSLKESDLHYIGNVEWVMKSNNGKYSEDEINEIYMVRMDFDFDLENRHKYEIRDLKWMPLSEFKNKVAERSSEFVPHWEEYEKLIQEIEK